MALTVPDVMEDFRTYYEANPAWGSLHIVLDDLNTDDGSVRFCIKYAALRGDAEGERLAKVLLSMSATQRRKIAINAT